MDPPVGLGVPTGLLVYICLRSKGFAGSCRGVLWSFSGASIEGLWKIMTMERNPYVASVISSEISGLSLADLLALQVSLESGDPLEPGGEDEVPDDGEGGCPRWLGYVVGEAGLVGEIGTPGDYSAGYRQDRCDSQHEDHDECQHVSEVSGGGVAPSPG